MGRPAGYQWRPLGWTEDPVPGDPAAISEEARHLASVAAQITDQVSTLRQIAARAPRTLDDLSGISGVGSDVPVPTPFSR